MAEDALVDLHHVKEHERIDHFAKIGVDIECEQFGVESQILPQQHGNRALTAFDFLDKPLDMRDVADGFGALAIGPTSNIPAGRRIARRNQLGKRRRQPMPLKELHDEFLRHRLIVVGNADRAEHSPMAPGNHEASDALPQQCKRKRLALVLRSHEGTPEFHRIAERIEHGWRVVEERAGVEPVRANVLGHNSHHAGAISPNDFLGLSIPHDDLHVGFVKSIEINRLPRTFANIAEGNLA